MARFKHVNNVITALPKRVQQWNKNNAFGSTAARLSSNFHINSLTCIWAYVLALPSLAVPSMSHAMARAPLIVMPRNPRLHPGIDFNIRLRGCVLVVGGGRLLPATDAATCVMASWKEISRAMSTQAASVTFGLPMGPSPRRSARTPYRPRRILSSAAATFRFSPIRPSTKWPRRQDGRPPSLQVRFY